MVKGPVQVPLISRVSPGDAAVMAGWRALGLVLQSTTLAGAATAGATPASPAAPAISATGIQRRRTALPTSMSIWILLVLPREHVGYGLAPVLSRDAA